MARISPAWWAWPFPVAFIILLPYAAGPYVRVWGFLAMVYACLALSYDVVGGRMGYVNLGHATFFGLGAYVAAVVLNYGCSPTVAFGAALGSAVAAAVLLSYPIFRLRGAYFSLATFGVVSLMEVLARNLTDITGGSGGMSVPPGDRGVAAYYLASAVASGAFLLNYWVSRSRLGFALAAIRDDEEAASAAGVPISRTKRQALVLSSVPAGLIGGVYVWNMTYISPDSVFGLEIALSPIIMAMLGGSGTLAGPVIGVLFLSIVQEILWVKIPYLHLALYGLIMVCVGLFIPGGIVRMGWVRRLTLRMGFARHDGTGDGRHLHGERGRSWR